MVKKKRKNLRLDIVLVSLFALSLSLFYFYGILPQLGLTGFATTATQVGNLTVGVQTFVACTWANADFNVTFGDSIDPGVNDRNASLNWAYPNASYSINQDLNNGTSYNVTIDSTTNVV